MEAPIYGLLIKMKNARAGRVQFADVTVVLIKYADL